MNFLKKVFFGSAKQQPKAKNQGKQQQSNEVQIPIQVLTELFEKSTKCISQSSKPISDQDKLVIYGLYKQATVGDCNTAKPSMLDFVGKSKWNAWNSNLGMSKIQAMKMYISNAVSIDPQIQGKIQNYFHEQNNIITSTQQHQQPVKKVSSSAAQSTAGLKMVEQKDYSNTYSHPYFRLIEKNLPIQKQGLSSELLLQKNNSPTCYPLHFAIDKQRVDLVREFLKILTVEQIYSMTDEDGTGIQEYAELIENQEIIQLVKEKLQS